MWPIGWPVTLNRPEKRNALNAEVLTRLPEALSAQGADDDVDVVILTGADPAFCLSVDLSGFQGAKGDTSVMDQVLGDGRRALPRHGQAGHRGHQRLRCHRGLEVALACDFLVASERASFADTHARVGVMPGWGLTVLLPQAVGVRREAGDVDHRQLRGRRDCPALGSREPRGPPRQAPPVLPAAGRRHRAPTTGPASARCWPPITR